MRRRNAVSHRSLERPDCREGANRMFRADAIATPPTSPPHAPHSSFAAAYYNGRNGFEVTIMSAVLDTPVRQHRFSRAQYEHMVDAGILGPDDRLELLDGEIIDMAPQKSRHATALSLTYEALRANLPEDCHIRAQLPFNLDERSMPEPDIAVVPGQARDYRDAHPARALLIVEVADSTLSYDRIRKLAAYARAGVPEYWILDLNGATLEVCRAPLGDTYAERRILQAGERIDALYAPGRPLAVADLLP